MSGVRAHQGPETRADLLHHMAQGLGVAEIDDVYDKTDAAEDTGALVTGGLEDKTKNAIKARARRFFEDFRARAR